MYRYYLEEEMFVTPKESKTIHINEVFACDFIIYALLCQLDELVDVHYLKKREKIPAQRDIPKGRLYVKRYYHPIKHIMRPLKEYLDADDLSITPQPSTPIAGTFNKALNSEVKEDLNTSAVVEASVEHSATPAKAKEQRKPKPSLFQTLTKNFGKKSETKEEKVESKEEANESMDEVKDEAKDEVKEVESVKADKDVKGVKAVKDDVKSNGVQTVEHKEVVKQDNTVEVDLTKCEVMQHAAAAVQPTIQIVSEGTDSAGATIQINPNAIQIISCPEQSDKAEISENQIQIISSDSGQIQIVSAESETTETENQVQISENQIQISETPLTNQIEIVQTPSETTNDQIQISENQIQISENSIQISAGQIQILPSLPSTTGPVENKTSLLPSIISSEQTMESSLSVDICHSSDGSITIAPIQPVESTARFEEPYIDGDKTLYRKCFLKEETICQGDTVYIRCGETDTESWKIGRIMEFYQCSKPSAKVMWFYGEEEMVVSKNELAGIHEKEIFASTCFDEVELSAVESKVSVVYLQKGESIPKDVPVNTLYCKRFYDPFKHVIRQLKTRLKAGDVSILPEPAIKRPRTDNVVTKVAVQSLINGTETKAKKIRTESPTPSTKATDDKPAKIESQETPKEASKELSESIPVSSEKVTVKESPKVEPVKSVEVSKVEAVEEASKPEVKPSELVEPIVVSPVEVKPQVVVQNMIEVPTEDSQLVTAPEEPSDTMDTVYDDY